MPRYKRVDGVAHEIDKRYLSIDGVSREIDVGYVRVDGVSREYFKGGPTVAELPVGSSVFLEDVANGTVYLREYIVVHQGNPNSAMYDVSCDGTWLLKKFAYLENSSMAYGDSQDNDYRNSRMHRSGSPTLSTTDLTTGNLRNVKDSTKQFIKQVKIPYFNGPGNNGTMADGADGFQTYSFLLSAMEVGLAPSPDSRPTDGACLDYFAGSEEIDTIRKCDKENGSTVGVAWWLRTPMLVASNRTADAYLRVDSDGSCGFALNTIEYGVRPALVLDSRTRFDPETNIVL